MERIIPLTQLQEIERQAIKRYLELRSSKDPKIATTRTEVLIEMALSKE